MILPLTIKLKVRVDTCASAACALSRPNCIDNDSEAYM